MEQTLAMLQEEFKKEEYKPLMEELKKYNNSSKKYEERKAINKRVLTVFSKNEQEIAETFMKEFKEASDEAEAYISLAEQFIPKKDKMFEDVLIGRVLEKNSEELFSSDEEVAAFAYKIVETSQVGIWGMSYSDSLYERAERHIMKLRKKNKI